MRELKTAHGFLRGYLMRCKQVHGFQTGDHVRAVVPNGKKAGTHVGRVAVRASGSFNIQKQGAVVQGISHRHCRIVQRGEGYGYAITSKPGTATPPSVETEGFLVEDL